MMCSVRDSGRVQARDCGARARPSGFAAGLICLSFVAAIAFLLAASMPTAAQSPYPGTPIPVPGTFEAEDFDRGGEGVAYHDNVKGNAGGQYRTSEDVDIIASSDSAGGGYVVNNFETGEWLIYTVNVQTAGRYDIELRVSSNWSPPPRFHVEIDGVDVTGSITVPNTGSWSTFQWVGRQGVLLGAGRHLLKIAADQQYFDLNSIRIAAAPAPAPFTGTPIPVPGTFEAEDFDRGGEGVAYHDNVKGNAGGQYRKSEDVDIIASSDSAGGGYVVNNFETGEWLAYTVHVAQTATYRIDIRASNSGFTPSFHIEIDGANVTGSVRVPDTGSWSVFQDVGKGGITLNEGQHMLRLAADQQYFNINRIRITKEADVLAGVGQWSGLLSLPIVAIHLHLLPDGAVLAWGNDNAPPRDGKAQVRLWDPNLPKPVIQEVPNPFVDVYCSGHSFLADGRLLVLGGHIHDFHGADTTTFFDFRSRTWSAGPRMSAGRWYPTNTTLSNGEVVVVSGAIDSESNINTVPEVWNAATGSRPLNNAELSLELYPWMHLAPNGKIFYAGPGRTTRYLDSSGTGGWTMVALTNFGDRHQYEGTSVMYEPGKVLIVGGGNPATASAEVINLNDATPQWRYTNSMTYARRFLNATILPDGKVLVTGGSSSSEFSDPRGAVNNAEVWDPATGSWSTLAAMNVWRLYHSTAVLLPDGRVLTAGGGGTRNNPVGDNDHYDAEYYSPPYLFKGARPAIGAAPESVGYGEAFVLGTPDAADVKKLTLVGLSSTTHEFNQNQRFIPLVFSQTTDGTGLNVTAPANPNIAPPGYYMLFILNSAGVPSIAKMVRIAAPGTAR